MKLEKTTEANIVKKEPKVLERVYSFPAYGKSVKASSLQEAIIKVKNTVKKDK